MRILVVDDEIDMGRLVSDALRLRGYEVTACAAATAAWDAVMDGAVDILVTDVRMRDLGGLELCDRVVANRPDVPVIVMTAFGSLETAIATIRAGAFDFLAKPFEIDEIVLAVERAITHRALRREVKRLRLEQREPGSDDLFGGSRAMSKVLDLVQRVAGGDTTVLVTGETGSGKELVARAIHERSARCEGPLVAINCGAVSNTLLESELFGHVKGAFTDARENRTGMFVAADGGTLLLDEIGDMPLAMQVKLLRALETRTVRAVGSNVETPFDARIIAATHRDLESAVEAGSFREDLLYRLNVIQVDVPPLRARGNDILLLAQRFLVRFAERSGKDVREISPSVAERLLAYAWPGNVRELQNAIERAVAVAQHEQVVVEDLPEKIREYRRSHVLLAADDPAELVSMDEVERRYVMRVLESVGHNKSLATRILGWDRKTLYRRLERWGAGGA